MPLLGRETPPEVKAWTVRKYASRLAYLDDKLEGREFLLDRFSVADAYLATVLNWTQATPEIDLAPTRTSRPISSACASARASPRRFSSSCRCTGRRSRERRRPDDANIVAAGSPRRWLELFIQSGTNRFGLR